MLVVTDSGTDVSLTPEEMAELGIYVVPLMVSVAYAPQAAFVDMP